VRTRSLTSAATGPPDRRSLALSLGDCQAVPKFHLNLAESDLESDPARAVEVTVTAECRVTQCYAPR
jgi:hypothetical protein